MIENVGLIGVGTMGEPMGESLLRAGFSLHTCAHKHREPIDRLTKLGAVEAKDFASVAAQSGVVIIMVPDSPQVEKAIFAPGGVAQGIKKGGVVIDMSTISPVASRWIHEQLAHREIGMLDAPVSGGPARAKTGELTIMVGGDEKTFKDCEPVLKAMGKATHVGPAGMGETFKLANQIIIANVMIANIEALVFAKKSGADIDLLREVLATATASNYLLEKWLPQNWLRGTYKGGFALDLLRKDLNAALEAAKTMNVPMLSSALAYQLYTVVSGEGHGNDDYSAVADLYERASSVSVARK